MYQKMYDPYTLTMENLKHYPMYFFICLVSSGNLSRVLLFQVFCAPIHNSTVSPKHCCLAYDIHQGAVQHLLFYRMIRALSQATVGRDQQEETYFTYFGFTRRWQVSLQHPFFFSLTRCRCPSTELERTLPPLRISMCQDMNKDRKLLLILHLHKQQAAALSEHIAFSDFTKDFWKYGRGEMQS